MLFILLGFFDYTISIANSSDSLVSDVIVKNCTMNGVQVRVSNGTVTGTIGLGNQRVNTLRVYIEWFDGQGENMDNADDTSTTSEDNSVAKISVNANFIQLSN